MQASKINLDKIYAVQTKDGLKRFRPSVVITARKSNHKNPHDYESWVKGHIMREEAGAGLEPETTLTPDKLLGEYTEYKELVEREAQAQTAAKAKDEAKRAAREELAALLREISGIDDPPSTSKYSPASGTIIRPSYSSVDVSDEAILPLTEALKRLRGLTALHRIPLHLAQAD